MGLGGIFKLNFTCQKPTLPVIFISQNQSESAKKPSHFDSCQGLQSKKCSTKIPISKGACSFEKARPGKFSLLARPTGSTHIPCRSISASTGSIYWLFKPCFFPCMPGKKTVTHQQNFFRFCDEPHKDQCSKLWLLSKSFQPKPNIIQQQQAFTRPETLRPGQASGCTAIRMPICGRVARLQAYPWPLGPFESKDLS